MKWWILMDPFILVPAIILFAALIAKITSR